MPFASISCPHCETIHRRVPVERDEDGCVGFDLDAEPCHLEGCEVKLCASCPAFSCAWCGLKYCQEHAVQHDDGKVCEGCVKAEMEEVSKSVEAA